MGTPFIHSIREADEIGLRGASLVRPQVIEPKTVSEADERDLRGASLVKRWGIRPQNR